MQALCCQFPLRKHGIFIQPTLSKQLPKSSDALKLAEANVATKCSSPGCLFSPLGCHGCVETGGCTAAENLSCPGLRCLSDSGLTSFIKELVHAKQRHSQKYPRKLSLGTAVPTGKKDWTFAREHCCVLASRSVS